MSEKKGKVSKKRPKIITRKASNNTLTIDSPSTSDNELDKLELGLNSLRTEKVSAKDRVIYAHERSELVQENLVDKDDEDKDDEDNASNNGSNSHSEHTNKSSEIQINLMGLPQRKINQLKRLKKLIKICHAYSILYYYWSGFWKKMYWASTISATILASSTIVVNTFFDPCSNQQSVRNYNVLLGSLITILLGIKSVMNATLRQKNFEDAGDEYKILAQEIYREVFFCNLSYEELDLASLIEKFSIKFDAFTKNFKEPSPSKIDEIMNSTDYGLAVKFIL